MSAEPWMPSEEEIRAAHIRSGRGETVSELRNLIRDTLEAFKRTQDSLICEYERREAIRVAVMVQQERLRAKIDALIELRIDLGNEFGGDAALAKLLDGYRARLAGLGGDGHYGEAGK